MESIMRTPTVWCPKWTPCIITKYTLAYPFVIVTNISENPEITL